MQKGNDGMMTDEERVAALHKKMHAYRRKKDRRITAVCGVASSVLLLCLILLPILQEGPHEGSTSGMYSGSALLFSGIGGYVLIGVLAFIIGVGIAVFCIRKNNRNKDE